MVFEFSLGGYFSSHNYTVRLEGDLLYISDCLYPMPPEWEENIAVENKIPVTDNENWAALLTFLKACNWQKTYDSYILDGTQWELKAKGKGCNLKVYGSNAYPENFDDFLAILNKLISPAGIKIEY
jgi:hypothetical protein